MARTSTQGQSYPLLTQIKDEATRTCLRMLMDQINALRQPAASTDFGGNKLTGVADPTSSSDAATKNYVDTTASPAAIRASILAGGSNPLDVTALRGQLSQVQRAKLRVNPAGNSIPSTGQAFELLYDVDTANLYYFDASTALWIAL